MPVTLRLAVVGAICVLAAGCTHARLVLGSESNFDRYREADIRLFLQKDAEVLLELLEVRNQEEFSIAGSKSPARQEVLLRLDSRIPSAREEGLIVVIARKWTDGEVLDAVLANYDPLSSFLSRLYAARVFNLLEPEQIAHLSSRLAPLLRSERDERIRSAWFAVIQKLPWNDALPILGDFMVSGSPLLQRMAYAVTCSMGRPASADLKTRLIQEQALDALRLMAVVDEDERIPQ